MRQFHRAILVTLSLVVSPAAFAAASADICYSAPTPVCGGGVCQNPTSTTLFDCPIAGQKTLPELAFHGWAIIQLSGYSYSLNPNLTTQVLVIAKRDRLFANGFEVGSGS